MLLSLPKWGECTGSSYCFTTTFIIIFNKIFILWPHPYLVNQVCRHNGSLQAVSPGSFSKSYRLQIVEKFYKQRSSDLNSSGQCYINCYLWGGIWQFFYRWQRTYYSNTCRENKMSSIKFGCPQQSEFCFKTTIIIELPFCSPALQSMLYSFCKCQKFYFVQVVCLWWMRRYPNSGWAAWKGAGTSCPADGSCPVLGSGSVGLLLPSFACWPQCFYPE